MAAVGTHPTGIHSCYVTFFKKKFWRNRKCNRYCSQEIEEKMKAKQPVEVSLLWPGILVNRFEDPEADSFDLVYCEMHIKKTNNRKQ